MPENITTGTFNMPTPLGMFTRHQYIKVEKTFRGKVKSTEYFVIEDREFAGGDDLEETIAKMRELAKGLSSTIFLPKQDYSTYEEIPTFGVFVSGERPATEEEIRLIKEMEETIASRRSEQQKAAQERMIAELNAAGFEVVHKEL